MVAREIFPNTNRTILLPGLKSFHERCKLVKQNKTCPQTLSQEATGDLLHQNEAVNQEKGIYQIMETRSSPKRGKRTPQMKVKGVSRRTAVQDCGQPAFINEHKWTRKEGLTANKVSGNISWKHQQQQNKPKRRKDMIKSRGLTQMTHQPWGASGYQGHTRHGLGPEQVLREWTCPVTQESRQDTTALFPVLHLLPSWLCHSWYHCIHSLDSSISLSWLFGPRVCWPLSLPSFPF